MCLHTTEKSLDYTIRLWYIYVCATLIDKSENYACQLGYPFGLSVILVGGPWALQLLIQKMVVPSGPFFCSRPFQQGLRWALAESVGTNNFISHSGLGGDSLL